MLKCKLHAYHSLITLPLNITYVKELVPWQIIVEDLTTTRLHAYVSINITMSCNHVLPSLQATIWSLYIRYWSCTRLYTLATYSKRNGYIMLTWTNFLVSPKSTTIRNKSLSFYLVLILIEHPVVMSIPNVNSWS